LDQENGADHDRRCPRTNRKVQALAQEGDGQSRGPNDARLQYDRRSGESKLFHREKIKIAVTNTPQYSNAYEPGNALKGPAVYPAGKKIITPYEDERNQARGQRRCAGPEAKQHAPVEGSGLSR